MVWDRTTPLWKPGAIRGFERATRTYNRSQDVSDAFRVLCDRGRQVAYNRDFFQGRSIQELIRPYALTAP